MAGKHHVKGYSYKRHGKTVHVAAHTRENPTRHHKKATSRRHRSR
jgi:hypothetical protein